MQKTKIQMMYLKCIKKQNHTLALKRDTQTIHHNKIESHINLL